MHTRYLKELAGTIEPESGLSVFKMRDFDFEYQVARHLESAQRQGNTSGDEEFGIRLALAVGQAWLWPEPKRAARERPTEQLDLFA
jgi:hypothetical protein